MAVAFLIALTAGAVDAGGERGSSAAATSDEIVFLISGSEVDLEDLEVVSWKGTEARSLPAAPRAHRDGHLVSVDADCTPGGTLLVSAKGWTTLPVPLSERRCSDDGPIELQWLPAGVVHGKVEVPLGEGRPEAGRLTVSRCPDSAEQEQVPLGEYPVRFERSEWSAQVPAGCLDLTLSVPPFSPVRWTAVRTLPNRATRVRDLALVRGAAIDALVMAAESGRGVAGGVVYLVPEIEFATAAEAVFDRRTVDAKTWRRSDARGWVRFEAVPAGRYYLVVEAPPEVARAPGFSELFEVGEGEEVVVEEVRLPEPASLRVAIEWADDSPPPDHGRLHVQASPILGSERIAVPGRSLDLGLGRFGELEELMPGRWEVGLTWAPTPGSVASLGRQEILLTPGTSESLTFELAAAIHRGRVTSRGDPIAGTLTLRPHRNDADVTLPRTKSNQEGMFSVVVPERGPYRIDFWEDGGGLKTTVPRVRFDDPSRLVEVELPEGRIEGWIVDEQGERLSEAVVSALGMPGAASEASIRDVVPTHAYSDANGRFVLEGLPEGQWTLRGRAGTMESEPLILDLALDQVLAGVRLVVEETVPVEVRVVSEHGEPVRGAKALVTFPHSIPGEIARGGFFESDPQGRLELRARRSLSGRAVTIAIGAAGHARTVARTSLAPRAHVVLPRASGRLELVPESSWRVEDLSGRALGLVASDGGGTPLQSLLVVGQSVRASLPRVGSKRPIVIPDLAPGSWRLVWLTGRSADMVALIEGLGHQLPTVAAFTILPGGTTRVEVPEGERTGPSRDRD